ncbi:MAG TPA: hypothetical protein VGR15_03190, partial [Bacteroidota bacterium]|nr:hypothetical protein [Bacteroidota bacterium]
MKYVLLLVLLLTEGAYAQQRYLVSPNDDFFPIRKGESARQLIKKKLARSSPLQTAACTDKATFGYPEELFQANVNHVGRHKDVMGMWFVAKASGSIDSLYWEVLSDVGALDSTLYIRVHESNIGPEAGPGVRPGPYNPPCQNWGYWVNTADLDRQVGAFIDEATPDTTWHSTYNGPTNTFPPFGQSLYGGTQGVAVIDRAGVNGFALAPAYDSLTVTIGQKFFISMRVKGPAAHPSPLDEYTSWATSSFRVADVTDENYPSRNWKFYEHDSGPANCAGVPVNDVKRGWVARGGFGEGSDSLDVAALNWWFVMTVSTNIPPIVSGVTQIHNTFSTGPQIVEATITDCDPAVGGHPGVESALVKWSLDGVPQSDLPADNSGGDTWEVTLPGQPAGSTVSYKFIAEDSVGATAPGPQYTYRVVSLGSPYYYADTGASCISQDIRGTGTTIDPANFYLPPGAATNAAPKDDGTAGPFDMGFDMTLFGEESRYAWIGIDGGIAISNNLSDTVDVNATGFYTTDWDFPDDTRSGGRSDTSAGAANRMPQNFIAPFWNDLFLGDSLTTCGRIMYGNAGDTCLFIVEYDSIGTFGADGNSVCDETTFRVVLNRCDGTVEFQYDNVGLTGLDSLALVGMGGKSSSEYTFINKQTYPYETKPRSGWCVKLYPGTVVNSIDAWNMVSVGVTPFAGNYSKAALYPSALGNMFKYTGTYVASDPLSNGIGLWAKFSGVQPVGARGTLLNSLTQGLIANWNMIGTIGHPVTIASIIQTNCTVAASSYFGYSSAGYYAANLAGPNNPSPGNLLPGYGYWAKATGVSGSPSITMNAGAAAPKQNMPTDLSTLSRITIIDGGG